MPATTTSRPSVRRRLAALRRTLLRRRRLLASAAAGLAVLAVAGAVRPPEPATTPVVVAARDLPAGTTVSEDDVAVVDLPPEAAPAAATSVDDLLGAVLSAPVAAREPVGPQRVVGTTAWEASPGEVAVPVRIPDAGVVGLLSVGDEVDVLATDAQGSETVAVAYGARVAALPEATTDPALGGRLVVLVVEQRDVEDLVGAAAGAFVSVVYPG